MKNIILCLGLLLVALPAFAAKEPESVYDRVMRTQTIRCGYGLWSPHLLRDPNTGKFSGIYYDFIEAMGEALHLKIEWTEETGWGDFIAGLVNDRFDAYCTVVGWNAERARQVDFITPIFYLGSDIFVRENDTRFDNHPERLDSPDITMTTIEGDLFEKITRNEFPQAKTLELSQLATSGELFLSVADGKADAALTESPAGVAFMQENPGKLRRVDLGGKPFRYVPVSISVKGGEYRFQRMLDVATVDLISSGTINKILNKYDTSDNLFLRVATPYEQAP